MDPVRKDADGTPQGKSSEEKTKKKNKKRAEKPDAVAEK